MKKLTAMILAVLMLLSMTACGGSSSDTTKQEDTPKQKTEEKVEEKTEEKAEEKTEEPAEEPEEAPVEYSGTLVETKFFALNYPEGWAYDPEKNLNEGGTYASLRLALMDGENEIAIFYVKAEEEGPYWFRRNTHDIGIDAHAIADGTADMTPIGGVDCYGSTWDSWGGEKSMYYGRVEPAGMTVTISVEHYGDITLDDPLIMDVMNSLRFTLPDNGNVDPPWPWEGEPFDTETPKTTMVGSYNIQTDFIKLDPPLSTYDIFSPRIAVNGEEVWIINDEAAIQYAFDGTKLTHESDLQVDHAVTEMTMTKDGTLFLSEFMKPMETYKDGTKTSSNEDTDIKYVCMSPDGSWGISYFSGPDLQYITFADGIATLTPWTCEEIDLIRSVDITPNYMFISGSTVENGHQGIAVYDHEGNLLMMLGDKASGEPDCIGSITAVAETENGFIASDGNSRTVMFWKADGTFVGELDDGDLFGTGYSWLSDMVSDGNGGLMVVLTEERADKSCDEVLVFRLSGF